MTNREKLIDALDLICLAEGGADAYERDLVLMAEAKLKTLAIVLSAHERQVLVGDPDPNAVLPPQHQAKITIALKAKATAASAARTPAGLNGHEVEVLKAGGHSLAMGLKAKQAIERQRQERGQR
jgi:hypothetical protein